jgi:hypothetical protein
MMMIRSARGERERERDIYDVDRPSLFLNGMRISMRSQLFKKE